MTVIYTWAFVFPAPPPLSLHHPFSAPNHRHKQHSPFLTASYEVGTALCDTVHLERSGGWGAHAWAGLPASPDSCCKKERSQWDQGGGVQRPQSLNTNVLLMPGCEGHQEHRLNEAFIAASVYNKIPPPFAQTRTQLKLARVRTHFVSGPLSNQSATLQPLAQPLKFA